jgi:ABC-type transport system involved in multi-copper enzyme maturation permease subunit
MTAILLNTFGRLLSFSWLTGPIFAKELRVSSRRCRNYVLRFLYLSLLTGLLGMVWLALIERGGSALFRASRMAEAGKMVTMYTVWFQFCVTQVVAVVMLSTSISDEIYNRTLGLLMTTPISSFQIVMGKLLSKLLQLILLLAISLPVLAVVRVFGGVPWGYVVSSLCVTLTTMIFFGSVSLLFSVFTRRAYIVIIMTVLALFLILAVLPYFAGVLWFAAKGDWPGRTLTAALFYHNPYGVMLSNTTAMLGGTMGGMPSFYWPLHCCIVLALSLLVLLVCVVSVRRVALRQASGQTGIGFRKRRPDKNMAQASHNRKDFTGTIRRIAGPPVLWKELRFPLLGRHSIITRYIISIGLALLIISYVTCHMNNALDEEDTHYAYTLIFLGFGLLFSIVLPSTSITSEKESRSWPMLLSTTLDDDHILFGKLVGSMRRCLPVWLLLFGHVILFSIIGSIRPVAIVQMGILVFWVVVFLSGTGLYFSSRFRRTTVAVVINFALAAMIWIIAPLIAFLTLDAVNASYDLAEAYMDTNPVIHAMVIIDGSVGKYSPNGYNWPGAGGMEAPEAISWMLICMTLHVFLGLLFAWRAGNHLRRNIF